MSTKQATQIEWMASFFYKTVARAWLHLYLAERSVGLAITNGAAEEAVHISFARLALKHAEMEVDNARVIMNDLVGLMKERSWAKEERAEVEGVFYQLSGAFSNLKRRVAQVGGGDGGER